MFKKAAIILTLSSGMFFIYSSYGNDSAFLDESREKNVTVIDNGISFKVKSKENTVDDFLREQNIRYNSEDRIKPSGDNKIYSGSRLIIQRASRINIYIDDKKIEKFTFEKNVRNAVRKAGVDFREEDILDPPGEEFVCNGLDIKVTRVEIKKEKEIQNIDFETKVKEDDSLGWRTEKVIQGGKKGEREVVYEVVYHNGEEISRKKIDTKVIEEPTEKVIKKGTFVDLGKSHTGLASWYDQGPHPNLRARYPFEGDMFAANPWLPLGSYVKVTNKGNGKSVIVRINDRGPFTENRIIDLNVPAFKAIASLGAGVIDVKMEEIVN